MKEAIEEWTKILFKVMEQNRLLEEAKNPKEKNKKEEPKKREDEITDAEFTEMI